MGLFYIGLSLRLINKDQRWKHAHNKRLLPFGHRFREAQALFLAQPGLKNLGSFHIFLETGAIIFSFFFFFVIFSQKWETSFLFKNSFRAPKHFFPSQAKKEKHNIQTFGRRAEFVFFRGNVFKWFLEKLDEKKKFEEVWNWNRVSLNCPPLKMLIIILCPTHGYHLFHNLGSGWITAVEHTPCNGKVVGSNPRCWAFFSSLPSQ